MAGSSSDVMVFLTQNGVDVGAAARSIKLTTTDTEGLSFSSRDRDSMSVRGLLPPAIRTPELEMKSVLMNLNLYSSPLAKYCYLRELSDYNEKLFYRVMKEHTEMLMPLVYTPTVGDACLKYSLIFRRPKGLFISIKDKGKVADVLANWPEKEVESIVVTDGERILGLGDLGANGMGIPVGKLALYTALGGIPPEKTLPITLDVGTNNEANLNDPLYIGLKEKRVRGKMYDEFVEEFMQAAVKRFGKTCLIQFEDFGNANAFTLLAKYKDSYCTFNDDIQGTAAVAVAGLMASLRITGRTLQDNTILFQGAGEAALGIADLLCQAMVKEGISEKEAASKIWMLDSRGLLCFERPDEMNDHKKKYAKEAPLTTDLHELVKRVKPTMLIGASAQTNAFNAQILQNMLEFSKRPVIFALSNPTIKAECTAEDAFTHTKGKCVFASGSPFPPVTYEGKTYYPGQGNNAYIFPGIALAVNACKVTRIDDEVFLITAKTVAEMVSQADLDEGRVYPPLSKIQEVSFNIAVELAKYFFKTEVATVSPQPKDIEAFIRSKQYDFTYPGMVKLNK
ncbi:NADP-dependent malic enzyme-like isoform X1 [Varroa jacobsoni]|uniref:Malic enzyme n=1 Tax=Varroa destructor TaxID=109461 RepID=A0A7M7M5D3_VARDE|nr:NADP-dependent malic enzyme-like isoform X4 [Varroa destructor]XP_022710303.1 NADP-dependent malic enzyme-like isoform X1 [Varroa jacobsoni]